MEISLARRESPHTGRRLVSLARALCHDLPHTRAALEAGDINERHAQVTATLTSEDHALVLLTLADAAEAARGAGDPRTRSQLMVDTLVAKVTGRHPAGTSPATRGPVAIKLLVSAETLLGEGCEPGYIVGCGHVPATVARTIAATGAHHLRSTIQRLFHYPQDGALVAMESRSARFRGGRR